MSDPIDAATPLAAQIRHQLQLARRRWSWIPWTYPIGFVLSGIGLAAIVPDYRELGSPLFTVAFFAVFFLQFGWLVVAWWSLPYRLTPRIVPYFARELQPHGGSTTPAFLRGRGLYTELVALDELAAALGVTPLSAFGFEDDYFDQEIRWHPATEGLRSVEALRQGLDARLLAAKGVTADLDVLAEALRIAAEKDVAFSLILRLQKKDSLQAVMSREMRQGSFW
jgi:hypothetical protein